MATILIVIAIALLGLGLGAVLFLTIEVARQNGRLLLRIEALEQGLRGFGLNGGRSVLDSGATLPSQGDLFLASHPWVSLREGTNDLAILSEIVDVNCYHLPASFLKDDVVIDVGAHVGLFALAALDRACGEIYCFEPEASNAESARRHLAPYGERASLTQAAVWRSDREERQLHFQPYAADPENLGGGNVLHGEGVEVPALCFDDVLLSASLGGERRIRFVKLDCEGSEYPILLTSKQLQLVDEIAGEYHVVSEEVTSGWSLGDDFSLDTLGSCLASNGFDVAWTPDASGSNAAGMFFARRPS